jgi:hypothetical protein
MKEWDNLERAEPAEGEGQKPLPCLVLTSRLSEFHSLELDMLSPRKWKNVLGIVCGGRLLGKFTVYTLVFLTMQPHTHAVEHHPPPTP